MAEDRLHLLISSLSSGEKRYLTQEFKLYHSRKAQNYQRLYQVYLSNIGKTKEDLDLALGAESFPAHLGVLRNQCFDWVLSRLRVMNSNSRIDSQIRNLVYDAELLFGKGIYKAAGGKMRRAMKLIDKHERYELFAGAFRMLVNLELISPENTPQDTLLTISKLQQQFQETQDHVFKTGLLWSLAHQITVMQHLPFALENLPAISQHPLLSTAPDELATEAQIFWHHCKGTIYARRDDSETAEYHFGIMVKLYQKQPDLIKENEVNYFITLHNYCQVALREKLEQEVGETLLALEKIIHPIPSEFAMKRISASKVLCYYGNLFAWYHEFEIKEGLYNKIKEFEKRCNFLAPGVIRQLDPTLAQLYLTIALLLFREEDYQNALGWLNRQSSKEDILIDNRTKLQSRVLAILLHYHLNELSQMEYLIRKFYKEYPETSQKEPFFNLVLEVVEKASLALPLERIKVREEAMQKFESAQGAGIKSFKKTFFDFGNWLMRL